MNIPKFLFAETSDSENNDSESNNSIDSDIQKEYNFHGKNISKFSDDHVPGDECRASETESSDPDDNGSDMADFIADDDEIEEEEEENESESEEKENEEIEEKEDEESESEKKEDEEMEIKHKKDEIEYELGNKENVKEDQKNNKEKMQNQNIEESLIFTEKVQIDNVSMTYNITLKKKLKKLKCNERLAHRSLPSELIEFVTETNLSRPMSSKVLGLNKTTSVLGSDIPRTRYLKKDKLNESAPILKSDTMFKELTNTINSMMYR
ncbi:FK506-binding protein 5-like [Apis florea]|uniref:FK506-binding protein 5-like n=1 Tax=Apis florea TaxID=7463 RepID=UPI0012FF4D77|nr:FK506-binding protein 5-like [Apis florea]